MAWELLLLLISGLVSDTKGAYCLTNNKPVIQVCKDGTVSGTSVYIENRETPMDAVNCTCDVDIGGETVINVGYSGPRYSSCGMQFILGENGPYVACFPNTLSNLSPFSDIHFSKTTITSGYACLGLHTSPDSKNMTITCHEPQPTTPSTTTSQTSPAASPSTTTHSTTWETTPTSHKTVTIMSSVPTQQTTLSTSTLTESHPSPTGTVQYNSTSTEGTPNSNEGLSKITLIGIAAGGGGALLIILVIVAVCCIRKRNGASESDIVITENEVYGSNPSQNNGCLSSPPYTNQSYEIQSEYVPSNITKTDEQTEPLGGQHTKSDFSDGSAYSEIGELSTVYDRVKVVDDDDDQRASDDISSMYSVVHKHKHKQTDDDTVAVEQHVTTTSRVKAHGTGDY